MSVVSRFMFAAVISLLGLLSPALAQDKEAAKQEEAKAKSDALSAALKDIKSKREAKKYTEAITRATAILKTKKHYDVLIERGWSYTLLKNYKEAYSDYTAAIALQPKNSKGYAHRGWMLWKETKNKLAVVDLSKAIELNPKDDKSRFNRIQAYFGSGDKENSLKACLEYLQNGQDKVDAHFMLATAYWRFGQRDKVIPECDKALALNPKSPQVLNLRGVARLQKNDKRGFRDIYQATQLDPKALTFQVNLAEYLRKFNYHAEAIQFYDNALKLDAKNANLLLSRAKCYDETGRTVEAVEDLNIAIKIDSSRPDCLHYLSLVLLDLGDYYGCLKTLAALEKVVPGYPRLNALRLRCFNKMERFKECIEASKKNSEEGSKPIDWILLTEAHLALNNVPEAIKSLSKARRVAAKIGKDKFEGALSDLSLETDSAANLVKRGLIRSKLQDYKGAILDFDAALKLDPKNKVALVNKANFSNFIFRPREGLIAAEAALIVYPKDTLILTAKVKALIAIGKIGLAEFSSKQLQQISSKNGAPLLKLIEKYQSMEKRISGVDDDDTERKEYFAAWKAFKLGTATADQMGKVGYLLALWQMPSEYVLYAFEKCLRLDPTLAKYRLQKASWLNQMKLHKKAYYETTLVERSKGSMASVFFHRAGICRQKGDENGAIRLYDRLLNLDPAHAMAWRNRAICFERLGDVENAIQSHKKAVEANPKLQHSFSALGRLHAGLGRIEESLNFYSLAIKANPKSATAHYNRGWANGLQKRWLEAIADYSNAIKINPKRRDALINRGNAYKLLQKFDKAIADYSKLIEYYPKDSAGYIQRAHVLSRQKKDYKAAIKDYDKAIEFNPYFYAAYYGRAEANFYLENYKEAEPDFEKALNSRKYQFGALVGRAACRAKLGKFKEAIEDSTIIIKYQPKEISAYINRAYCRVELGEFEAAIKDASHAISVAPKEASAYRNRGRAYHGLKKMKEAIADFSEAIELEPKHAKGYLFRGRAFESQKEYKRMVADYKDALKRDKRLTETYLKLAKGLCHIAAQSTKREEKTALFKEATEYLIEAKNAKLWNPKEIEKNPILKELTNRPEYKKAFPAPKRRF